MKKVCVLIVSAVFLCACAMGQSSLPEPGANVMYWQQPAAPGPESAPRSPNVFFRAQVPGNGTFSTGYFAIADPGKPVTGAPYSATAITETTQVLADGNRIVNKTTAFLARDSEGRTRREETMGSIGPLAVSGPRMAFINDPISKTDYILDLNDQSARVIKGGNVSFNAAGMGKQVFLSNGPAINVQKKVIVSGGSNAGVEQRIWLANEAGQVKTESLGTQVIEGVIAEGKRVTRTIPAGEIGNERPLEITSEVWTSPELQLIVLSKRNDPRFGQTVYRLTDIKRAEPDHSLFEVPGNFTIKDAGN